jgi:hypothetical protein
MIQFQQLNAERIAVDSSDRHGSPHARRTRSAATALELDLEAGGRHYASELAASERERADVQRSMSGSVQVQLASWRPRQAERSTLASPVSMHTQGCTNQLPLAWTRT